MSRDIPPPITCHAGTCHIGTCHAGTCHATRRASNAPRWRQAGSRQAGFTLLEILVALVVLGVLLTALTQGMQFGLRAWYAQTAHIAQRSDMDAVDRALRRLIEHAIPGAPDDALQFVGTQGTAAFRTTLPIAGDALAPQGDAPEATVALGVDARHRLVLRWAPYQHVTPKGPRPPAEEEELLTGVDHIALSYWRTADPDKNGPAGAWLTKWDFAALPALVRIRIVFADRRIWPDIVAAPLLTRVAG